MKSKLSFWGRYVLAAVAYGLAYAALRESSLSGISAINWMPVAGLRLVCLLLAPMRYWSALMIGEAIPLSYQNYQCVNLFGLTWVMVASIPPMLYTAPIVYLLRKRWPDFEKNLVQHITPLLLCMFLAALTSALHGMLSYSLLKQLAPGEQPIPLWLYGSRLLTGGYLSLLTITPAALWIASGLRDLVAQRRLQPSLLLHAVRDARWRGTCALLVIMAGLVIMGHKFGSVVHALALAGLLGAGVIAAWRYGWQSTAIVGAAANLSIIALMPTHDDLLTIQLQCVIAVMLSGLLLFGVRTTWAQQLIQRERDALRMARQEMFANERHRLTYATMLDQVFDQTRQEATRVLHDVRAALPSSEIAKHYRQFDELKQTHQNLTAGLSPPAWLKLGGQDGPIAQALNDLGVRCEIDLPSPISGLARLSTELSIAVYRLCCEAVAYLVRHAPSDELRIAMAVYEKDGERPVVEVTLESFGDALTLHEEAYTPFLLSLGASGVNEQTMDRRARLYEGSAQIMRIMDQPRRIRLRLTDPAASLRNSE